MLTSSWFVDCCRKITEQKKNIWIAYSGGVDSHVLLHLAAISFPNVRAVHINHNLGPEDQLWQQHCEQVCVALKVSLQSISVDAKAKPKQSPEEAGRIARRKAWQNLLTADDVLFIAHHADDQAETILYRLFRGTGPKGMCGMQPHSKIEEVSLFRPLLNVSKQQILDYSQKHNLNWISDQSNQEANYARNYIRNKIMPLITHRWPKATANINRAGELCGQLLKIVNPVILQKLDQIYGLNNTELDLDKLQQCSNFTQTELLRAWLQVHNLTPSLNQIILIQKQVIAAKIDAKPKFVIADKTIRRSNNKLYILDNSKIYTQETFVVEWDLSGDLNLPTGQILKPEQLANLKVSKVMVQLGSHGRKAKKIFQQHDVPPWERSKYPLIFVDDKLHSIVGLWSSNKHN